jgi:hypothetical protein
MAKNTQLTNLVVNTEADALSDLMDNGWIDILDGAQPATGDTAITTQVLLVSLRLNATFAAAASAGVLTANSITSGTAVATGTAAWFRIYQADHTTAVFDGTVGTATSNLILPTTTITSGQTVAASAFTYTVAKSTSGT